MSDWLSRCGPPPRGTADLPGRIDVKTARAHTHRLIVQGDDDLDKRYVLVTIADRVVAVRGFIDACEVHGRREWWLDPVGGRPAYFVPASALHPISRSVPRTDAKEGVRHT